MAESKFQRKDTQKVEAHLGFDRIFLNPNCSNLSTVSVTCLRIYLTSIDINMLQHGKKHVYAFKINLRLTIFNYKYEMSNCTSKHNKKRKHPAYHDSSYYICSLDGIESAGSLDEDPAQSDTGGGGKRNVHI